MLTSHCLKGDIHQGWYLVKHFVETVQGGDMRAIKQYGAELTRKKDELFRIDIDSNITSDLHLKLSEGHDDNNPMITIVFKPSDSRDKITTL